VTDGHTTTEYTAQASHRVVKIILLLMVVGCVPFWWSVINQSKVVAMTLKHLAICSCIFFEAVCHGKGSRRTLWRSAIRR